MHPVPESIISTGQPSAFIEAPVNTAADDTMLSGNQGATDCILEVVPNACTASNVQTTCDTAILHQLEYFPAVHHEELYREAAQLIILAEESISSSERSEVEQQTMQNDHSAFSIKFSAQDPQAISTTQLAGAPNLNSQDAYPSPSGLACDCGSSRTRLSSQMSPQSHFTFAETISSDDASFNSPRTSSELRTRSDTQATVSSPRPSTISSTGELDSVPSLTQLKIQWKRFSPIPNPDLMFHTLLDHWPNARDPSSLSTAEVCQIRGVATGLAAASHFDDAFGLFHLEYSYWRDWTMKLSGEEIHPLLTTTGDNQARRMVTAAINCVRNYRHGLQAQAAHQMMAYVRAFLHEHGIVRKLDLALLELYLARLPREFTKLQSLDPETTALEIAVVCSGEPFEVIMPEIHHREHLFIATSLKAMQTKAMQGCSHLFNSFHASARCIELQTACLEDPPDACKVFQAAMKSILQWCGAFVGKNRRSFNKIGTRLPVTNASRVFNTTWTLVYCCFLVGNSIFESLVPNTESHCQEQLCTHGFRLCKLDTPLALAVICETIVNSAYEKTSRRFLPPRLGDYFYDEIDSTVHNWLTRSPTLIRNYISRMTDALTAPEILTRKYFATVFLMRKSPPPVSHELFSKSAFLAYSSLQRHGDSTLRTNRPGSFNSSINSIRSSMSLDTKRTLGEMIETRNRLRRPWSMISSRTNSSAALSIRSQGSNSFEKVTGMPSHSDVGVARAAYAEDIEGAEPIAIDRIDEEMEDV
jgi:hypothetical protein